MSKLDEIRPARQQRVMDLLQEAGFNVDDWANFKGGKKKAASNPKYCYEWCFVENNRLIALNLWHDQMKERDGIVSRELNQRGLAARLEESRDIAGRNRALRMDQALHLAAQKQIPLRIIVCDGVIRKSADPRSPPSKVKARLLDPIPWRVVKYDLQNGDCTLARGDQRSSVEGNRTTNRRFSSLISMGNTYTRDQIKEMLKTHDATLMTGVFKPKDFDSILLFVTREKTADRTQYRDHLEEDVLHWQGQIAGRTDSLIVGHERNGLELLVFYREIKYQFPKAAFRYEGPFTYASHEKGNPSTFVLKRSNQLEEVAREAEQQGAFDPTNVEDARRRTMAAIVRRRGQRVFRNALLHAYGRRCAVTGCDVEDVLEAAHIVPYKGDHTNHVSNGLLLRADVHTLFDLRLIAVDASTSRLVVSDKLKGTIYGSLSGTPLNLPSEESVRPNKEALTLHKRDAGL